MTFTSLEFIVLFLCTWLVYICLKRESQNWLLLLSSILFYGWWDARFLFLLFATAIFDHFAAGKISGSPVAGTRKKWLLSSLMFNLIILGFFKYFNFFASSFENCMRLFGLSVSSSTLNIVLPVGISFYTFQSMSYVIDVYRGNCEPCKKFKDYALYLLFFPQLVAGPIERADSMLRQFGNNRKINEVFISRGILLLLLGYFKKVGVADSIAPMVDVLYTNHSRFNGFTLLIAIYLFSVQIYCDFSGYSDIARGVASLFGFRLMENFSNPYFSSSITEFWRRWHISLSGWLRDYIYIPLGGNRDGVFNTYRNLLITMLLGGLWHGASWCFVVWGGCHGVYLMIHKYFGSQRVLGRPIWNTRLVRVLSGLFVFNLVTWTWVFFRSADFMNAIDIFGRVLTLSRGESWFSNMDFFRIGVLFLSLLVVETSQFFSGKQLCFLHWSWWSQGILYSLLCIVTLVFGGLGEDVPFIYFQF